LEASAPSTAWLPLQLGTWWQTTRPDSVPIVKKSTFPTPAMEAHIQIPSDQCLGTPRLGVELLNVPCNLRELDTRSKHPILGAQLLPHPARAPIVLRYWFLGAIPSWQDNCRNERPLLFCGWPRVTLLTNWWLLCVLLFVTWVICRNSLHHEQRGGKPKAARGWTQTNMGMLAL